MAVKTDYKISFRLLATETKPSYKYFLVEEAPGYHLIETKGGKFFNIFMPWMYYKIQAYGYRGLNGRTNSAVGPIGIGCSTKRLTLASVEALAQVPLPNMYFYRPCIHVETYDFNIFQDRSDRHVGGMGITHWWECRSGTDGRNWTLAPLRCGTYVSLGDVNHALAKWEKLSPNEVLTAIESNKKTTKTLKKFWAQKDFYTD